MTTSLEKMTTEQHTDTVFRIITNHQGLLFQAQAAYFLVMRNLLGYTPNKDMAPCRISRIFLPPDADLSDYQGFCLGQVSKKEPGHNLFYLLNPRSCGFVEGIRKEMADCAMEKEDIIKAINGASEKLLSQMFHAQYGDEMLAYAKLHRGNGSLPRNWQSLINQDKGSENGTSKHQRSRDQSVLGR